MARYALILLLFMAVAPMVPFVIEQRLGSINGGNPPQADMLDTGERSYRISRDRRGHFVASAYLNGRSVDMLVDTGATVTALPESVAEDIGIYLSNADYKIPIQTANGTVHGARAVIDSFRIGDIRLRNIDAIVLEDTSLGGPLLGMSVLNKLERFDMSGGTLVLVQ